MAGASGAVARQGEKGAAWQYSIDAVYLIAFVNFKMDGLGDEFRTDVALYDVQRRRPFTDKERFVFLQLPQFTKEADECKDDFERWIYVLKNMEVLDRMPWAAKDSVFRKLAEIAEVSNMSKDDRIKYDSALRHYRDTISVLQGARDSGRAEGRKEGRADVARRLKSIGMPVAQIVEVTGLTAQQIARL